MNPPSGNYNGTNEELLKERLAALEAATSRSPRVVSKLAGLIRSGDDGDLFRINPLRYADSNRVAEEPRRLGLVSVGGAGSQARLGTPAMVSNMFCGLDDLTNEAAVGQFFVDDEDASQLIGLT